MSLEQTIRNMISEELDKRQQSDNLIPMSEFCAKKNLSRTTIWRNEKQGEIKLTRIGRKIFIDQSQFTKWWAFGESHPRQSWVYGAQSNELSLPMLLENKKVQVVGLELS